MQEYTTHSREETVALGRTFARTLPAGALIAFTGGPGAGKTAFCQGLAEGLGCTDPASSPTFAIVNEYRTSNGHTIFHFDCYRIAQLKEALDMGCEDYFESGELCFIEWPENIEQLLPDSCVPVHITVNDDESRTITIG